MNEIIQSISTVGFPIVMCLILLFYMQEENKSHKEETASLKTAINNLEIAITRLCTYIGKETND